MAWRKLLVYAVGMAGITSAALAGKVDDRYYKDQSSVAKSYRAAKPSFDADILAALAQPNAPRHLPYDTTVEPSTETLEPLDPQYSIKRCDLMPDARTAAVALIDAANAEPANKGFRLYAASCYRSNDEQVAVFCNRRIGADQPCLPIASRMKASAPPGYSEHATGYTIDFVVRRPGDTDKKNLCKEAKNVEPCGAEMDSPTGRWLLGKGITKGFELSFPCAVKIADARQPCPRTKQGVMYEPWHWRWVGTAELSDDRAKAARKVFAVARSCFRADPFIPPYSADPETDKPIVCPAPTLP